MQTSTAKQHEAPGTSGHAPRKSHTAVTAVSQQTSVDLSLTTSPLSKVRSSAYDDLYKEGNDEQR